MVTSSRTSARRTRAVRLGGVLAASLLAGLGAVAVSAPAASSGAPMRPLRASSPTVWLCRPGQVNDPCTASPVTTDVNARGATSPRENANSPATRKFDCFYVYPTVSREPGPNADLQIQKAETEAAIEQVSQFSRVCNVWAPMYRQATVAALASGAALQAPVLSTAYDSLLSAWKDYLAHDNRGHPIVFIGHSQGAAMLIKLLRSQVDPSARLRRRMVSAIVLGGNVQVATGHDDGGSFEHIPTCSSASQTGCVIAYSTFGSEPLAASFFGRPGEGVSIMSGQTDRAGQSVACVNPVTFSSSAGGLTPLFPTSGERMQGVTVTTSWVSFPGLYTARCDEQAGATWLQVSAASTPGDPRPTVQAVLGPLWGYHLDDVNLALGNLVTDVATEEAAYR
jgi:Protein of unknown function (DUF3089)